MEAQKSETHEIRTSQDVVSVRQAVRRLAVEMGFNLVDQTKIVTASSELARNTLDLWRGRQHHHPIESGTVFAARPAHCF